MFLQEWFASIRMHRRRSTQPGAEEEGMTISRRLHELLDVNKPKQVATISPTLTVKTATGHTSQLPEQNK